MRHCTGRLRSDPSRAFSTTLRRRGTLPPVVDRYQHARSRLASSGNARFPTSFTSAATLLYGRTTSNNASMSPRLAARSYPRFGRCGGLAKSVKSPYPSPDSDSTLESRLEADTDRLRAASQPRSKLRGCLSTHDRSLTALVGSSVSRNYGVPNEPTTLQSSFAAPGLRDIPSATDYPTPRTPRRGLRSVTCQACHSDRAAGEDGSLIRSRGSDPEPIGSQPANRRVRALR